MSDYPKVELIPEEEFLKNLQRLREQNEKAEALRKRLPAESPLIPQLDATIAQGRAFEQQMVSLLEASRKERQRVTSD